jgi:hypothetical protein
MPVTMGYTELKQVVFGIQCRHIRTIGVWRLTSILRFLKSRLSVILGQMNETRHIWIPMNKLYFLLHVDTFCRRYQQQYLYLGMAGKTWINGDMEFFNSILTKNK